LPRITGNFLDIPFVAVTGSVGKTTTKEMIAEILKTRFKVLKTPGNFNNEIGLAIDYFSA
jgi:UDP-N-acetylmuramoyl-tripeptide--D-alanyl-D-alanine ligase